MAVTISNAGTQQLLMSNIPLPANTQTFSFMCYVTPVNFTSIFQTTNSFVCGQMNGTTTNDVDFAFRTYTWWGWTTQQSVWLRIGNTTVQLSTSNTNWDRCHLCVTYDGSTVTFYRNGVVAATSTNTGSVSSTANRQFCVSGVPTSPNTNKYAGNVEDIRIYNKALTLKEIQLILSANGKDGLYDKLIAWYQLNEFAPGGTVAPTVANSVKDHGPNKYDGRTYGASPTWIASLTNNTKARLRYRG